MSAFAATAVTSDITTDTRWMTSGSPYVINFDSNPYFPRLLTVAPGATLTVDPGAIVKFGAYNGIAVKGTLHAEGATSSPIIFTSLEDDTAGGDTNGDGTATVPTDEQWMHLQFNAGSSGAFDHVIVRYGGAHITPLLNTGIENNGGIVAIDHTTLTHNGYDGFGQYGGHTTLTNSLISNQTVGITMGGGELDVSDTRVYGNAASGIDHWGGTLSVTHSEIDRNGTGIVAEANGSISASNSSIHNNNSFGIDNQSQANGYDGITIDARNNWWGDASGPYDFTSNIAGTGNSISGNVAYAPWLTSDPFIPPDPCATPGACASNVLFLPGIEGSRLYRPDYSGGTDKLWEPTSDADVQDLYMNADGTSARSDVYTKDVIDTAYAPIKGNIYKSFLDDLYSWKNTDHLIADYGVAPYDWRLSLDDILNNGNQLSGGRIYYSGDLRATSSPYIIQELRRLAAGSKTGKVTIVAHSNGGLVAKALTEKLGSEASTLIDKIIFVAVPQVGTPKAIGAILHGYDQGLPLDSFPIALSDETARTFAKNMPSAYNLLPSVNYFTYVDDPVVTFDNSALLVPWRAKYGGEIHSKERLHTFIADQSRPSLPVSNDLYFPISGNETLLNNAEALHAASLDAWTPPQGIALTEIAGWGEETPKTIEYYQGWKTSCGDLTASTCPYYTTVPALEYKVKDVLDGDGTVVVPSALWTATATTTGKYWVDLESYGDTGFLHSTINRKHADILEVPTLRTLIKNILTGTSTALDFISTSTPPNSNPETRLRFTLHSPLALNLYDDLGNHTGFSTTTGLLEENIPGSRYQTYGELKYIDAPASTTLRLAMNGYATGSFTLDIEKESGDTTLASTTFAGIPSSTTTTATITVPQGGNIADATPLLVDYDGNGTTDFSLKPRMGKTSVFDITPPEAILTFDPVSQKLKIIGTDNLSSTTIRTTATSTVITDEADNTLQITFKKFKQEKHELKLELQALRYNGIATTTEKTTLGYEWSTDKIGNIRELEEKATAGTIKVEAHYDAKKNVTRIEKKLRKGNDDEKRDDHDRKETKEILPGMVTIGVKTEKGIITINY